MRSAASLRWVHYIHIHTGLVTIYTARPPRSGQPYILHEGHQKTLANILCPIEVESFPNLFSRWLQKNSSLPAWADHSAISPWVLKQNSVFYCWFGSRQLCVKRSCCLSDSRIEGRPVPAARWLAQFPRSTYHGLRENQQAKTAPIPGNVSVFRILQLIIHFILMTILCNGLLY